MKINTNTDAPDLSVTPKDDLLPPLELSFFKLDEQEGSLSVLESSETSSVFSPTIDERPLLPGGLDEECENVWGLLLDNQETHQTQHLKSWDTFLSPTPREIRSPYLSEQPIEYINAVFNIVSQPKPASNLLRSKYFLSALSQLGLGRTSSLFPVNARTGQSKCSKIQIEQSGFTHGLIEQIICDFQGWGHQWWALKSFLMQDCASGSYATTLMPFASALSTVLRGLEKRLNACFWRSESILQLHQHYYHSLPLLNSLTRTLTSIRATKTDRDFLLHLAEETTLSKFSDRVSREVMHEILRFCSQPLLLRIGKYVGLKGPQELLKEQWSQFHLADYEPMLSLDLIRTIEATNESLEILRNHQAGHPILNPFLNGLGSFDLTWETTWEGLENQRKIARDYERTLGDNVRKYSREECFVEVLPSHISNRTTNSLVSSHVIEEDLASLDWKEHDMEEAGIIPSPGTKRMFTLASLDTMADDENNEGSSPFEPQLVMALESSLRPLLSVQSAAVNYACLHLIFKESNLRSEIRLQWRFQFLMDSGLRIRLCEALFDTRPNISISLPNNEALPHKFSFSLESIRDDQLDAGSIEIVDLLCLHYQPSHALRYIFTERSLELYQYIFKSILRVLRLQYLTQLLAWQSANKLADNRVASDHRRFRLETYRFICALNDYISTYAVGLPFRRFEDRLREIEMLIDMNSTESLTIQDVQEMHGSMLDQITNNLFLGNDAEQRQIRKSLSDIYRLIFKQEPVFSKWKQRVAKLIALLRASETSSFKNLALKLDLNGYYG